MYMYIPAGILNKKDSLFIRSSSVPSVIVLKISFVGVSLSIGLLPKETATKQSLGLIRN